MDTNNKIPITICLGSSCFSRGNRENLEVIKRYIAENNLNARVQFKGQLCSERCNRGPVIWINDVEYQGVSKSSILAILNRAFGL
ncbi:MAG: (2Fe-2S) ferredoxin domain-containing protein [Bacteroidales bacterium]|nr:(2Fe-2S) ferredoxin domain-containing protein [Bacteroidales bacterium]